MSQQQTTSVVHFVHTGTKQRRIADQQFQAHVGPQERGFSSYSSTEKALEELIKNNYTLSVQTFPRFCLWKHSSSADCCCTHSFCTAYVLKIKDCKTYWKQALCQVSWRTLVWNESWILPPHPAQYQPSVPARKDPEWRIIFPPEVDKTGRPEQKI